MPFYEHDLILNGDKIEIKAWEDDDENFELNEGNLIHDQFKIRKTIESVITWDNITTGMFSDLLELTQITISSVFDPLKHYQHLNHQ